MGEQKRLMIGGELYQPHDDELSNERRRARAMTAEFNRFGIDEEQQSAVLEELLGSIGDGSHIRPAFRCDYGYNITIGSGSFVNYNCTFLDCAPISIGDDVQIASGVQLITASHPLDPELRRTGVEHCSPVSIHDNVWICTGALVLPNVTIGANSVIGAGSVVTRDVPAGVVAFGNPCRVSREL